MSAGLPRELARTTLAVLFMGLLIGATLWVLRPFLGPVIWAAMIVIASWRMMLQIERRLWGRRWLAVTVMMFVLLLLFVVPLTVAIGTIVANTERIVGWARAVTALRFGEPPAWMVALPYLGGTLVTLWNDLADLGIDELLGRLQPYAGNLTRWFVSEVGSLGFLVLQFLLTVLLAGLMYAGGEGAAGVAQRFGQRLGGDRGRHVVELAAGAIRGVALGVGVTAAVQSALGGLALALAGVPFAGLLTALMFMLCIAQLGPTLVLLPAAFWVLYTGSTGWGVFLLVCTLIVGTMDNVMRPVLIRMGADLPLLLIFAGVIGGLFAFGLVGIFVGPVVLAVAWTLLGDWLAEDAQEPPAEDVQQPPAA